MNEHTNWIEAAKILIENPNQQVLCPQCGMSPLRVEDEQLDRTHIDRHLKCPNCHAHEVILKRISDESLEK